MSAFFCQALGIHPESKYQSQGGPSISQSIELLKYVSAVPIQDIEYLLNAIAFNYCIGNNDAHGKNFSLLYQEDTIRLAPLYDLACTLHYPDVSKKIAMKLGGEYHSDKITKCHLEKLATEIKVKNVVDIFQVIGEKILAHLDFELPGGDETVGKLKSLIKKRCLTISGT